MDENPLDQLRRLQNELRKRTAKHGVELESFAVFPDRDLVHVIFSIDPESVRKTPEQRQADEAFQEIIAADLEREKQERRKKLRESLEKGEFL